MCIYWYHSGIIISKRCEIYKASDQEVSVLALATLANILVFSDTFFLADVAVIEELATGIFDPNISA